MSESDAKLSLPALTALVVRSMIGAGIFSLPATFGRATGAGGAIIAWFIAGGGMLALAPRHSRRVCRIKHPAISGGNHGRARCHC